MKKKIMLSGVIVMLIVTNSFIIYLLSKPNDNKRLEEVNTKDLLSNDKSIAIWVQDSEGEEWHEASNRDSWPSPTTHGYVGAECTDSDGKEIDVHDILQFDLSTYHATIDTKNSIYCTLYFAKGEPALDHLKKKGGNTFAGGGDHTTAVDGMYRFKGTATDVADHNLNNYICFGTTVESTCTTNASGNYMYRIIGITSEERTENKGHDVMWNEGQLKIIRAVPSSTSQGWYSNRSSNTPWDSSSAKTYLNGTFLNTIKGLADGTYWESMISSHKWYNADQTGTPGTTEPKTSQTAESKIGLMYGTDYMNANGASTSNWLFITNGWSGNPSKEEWTMSRYGADYYGSYSVWVVLTGGTWVWGGVYNTHAVRPVFYLQSGVNLTGEGTKDHPYIITTKNNA